MRKHIYEGDGRCIFCAQPFAAADLTDEHIIPEAIHGSLIIRKGSCTPCAQHSNRAYENKALNTDLKIARFILKMRGKGKIERTQSLRHLPGVYAGDNTEGSLGEKLDFPLDFYPKNFTLIAFYHQGAWWVLTEAET